MLTVTFTQIIKEPLTSMIRPATVQRHSQVRANIFNRFILNGLVHANEILGKQLFNLDDWKVIGEYVFDVDGGRHQAFYSPKRDFDIQDIHFRAGERIQVEQSLKYSTEQAAQLWEKSRLNEVGRWSASSDSYSKCSCRSPILLFRNYRTANFPGASAGLRLCVGQLRAQLQLEI